MTIKSNKIKFYILYLIGCFVSSSVLFWWITFAADDFLWHLIEPSYYSNTTLGMGVNVKTVWDEVLGWSNEINIKFKKVVPIGENGQLLCLNGPCPEWCTSYDEEKDKEGICPWQHKWASVEVSWKKIPMVVKVTRLLLSLVIALSVTMILYNGIMYIVQTWQWKEWKSLMKNIILIVVGILISLFSVLIIRLIQSIPYTLDEELSDAGYQTDNEVLTQD